MADSISKIKTLLKAFKKAQRGTANLCNTLFPQKTISDKRIIQVDEYEHTKRAARFTKANRNVQNVNAITSVVHEPKEISEGIPVSESAGSFSVVAPGEDNYTSSTLAKDIIIAQELNQMIETRKDLMASQVLTTGKILDQDGGLVIDYERKPELNVVNVDISGNNDPTIRISQLHKRMVEEHGMSVTEPVLICGTTAYSKLVNNAIIAERLKSRINVELDRAWVPGESRDNVMNLSAVIPMSDLTLQGKLSVYTYPLIYKNNQGNITPIIPPNAIILTTMNAMRHQIYTPFAIPVAYDRIESMPGEIGFYSSIDANVQYNFAVTKFLLIPENVNHIAHITVA